MNHPPSVRAGGARASAARAALLLAVAATTSRADFPFENIDFWVGEGTNAAVVVVDWGRDDASAVLAWGYRWNGAATAADAILAIDQEDPRLNVAHTTSNYGLYLTGFAYRPEDGGPFEAVAEDYYGATSSWGK